jgi:hypothetical protein
MVTMLVFMVYYYMDSVVYIVEFILCWLI